MKALLLLFALVSASLAFGCGSKDDTCKNYAALEWKCGDYPESEKEMTLKLAEGMCVNALGTSEKDEVGAMFRHEVECAKKAKDCAAYAACKEADADE